MKLMNTALVILGLTLPMVGFCQEPTESPKVTISSTGADVRFVLSQMFQQAGKPYVLQIERRTTVELALRSMPLDQALQVVCVAAKLNIDVKDGIYYVRSAGTPDAKVMKKPVKNEQTSTPSKPNLFALAPTKPGTHEPANFGHETRIHFLNSRVSEKPVVAEATPVTFKPIETPATLPVSVLQKKVSARMTKTEIRTVFENLSKQTGVKIEISPTVPAYRIDTYLLKTSLKYAMDRITEAAGLEYKFTDRNSILVNRPKRVAVALKSN